MGVTIPVNYGLLAFHTKTDLDPEEMLWTVGVNLTSVSDPQDVCTDAHAAWSDHIADLTSTIVDLTRVTLKVGPSSTGATYQDVTAASGNDGGSLLPPNSAVLVQKLTNLGGRKGRGRVYLPGISEISGTLDSSGTFSSGEAGVITAAMNALLLDIGTGSASEGAPLVLLHSDSTTPTLIVQFFCENKIATQRRRLRP